MNICIIGTFPPFKSGIASHNYFLAAEIEKNHNLSLIGYHKFYPLFFNKRKVEKHNSLKEDIKINTPINDLFVPYNPFTWQRCIKEIQKIKPDIIILPWWFWYTGISYYYLINRLLRYDIKIVFICHHVFLNSTSHNIFKKSLDKFSIKLTTLLFKKITCFLVPSVREFNQIKSFHPGAKIEIHLHPIYNYNYIPEKKDHTNDKMNFLFFGYIRFSKGLDLLIEALSKVKNKNYHLYVAGQTEKESDKDYYIKLAKTFSLEEYISFDFDYISNDKMKYYFNKADVVVLPYREGTSSGIIASSYNFKKPVLITKVGGLPDAVEDEKTGKIIEEPNANLIANGIDWFIKNQNENFGLFIDQFVEQKMSWNSLVNKIIKLTSNDYQ